MRTGSAAVRLKPWIGPANDTVDVEGMETCPLRPLVKGVKLLRDERYEVRMWPAEWSVLA